MSQDLAEFRTAIWRGFRRRCPRCGVGALFARWFALEKHCSHCDLLYEEKPGDTWAFWLIGDRIFLGILIIAIFLVFRSANWAVALVFLVATGVPLVWTMPHRMGVCVALDFLLRERFGNLQKVVRD